MKQHFSQMVELKSCILNAADYYDTFCFLDSCKSNNKLNWIAGLGSITDYSAEYNVFSDLNNFILTNKGKHLFGHLNYDCKNKIETLQSNHNNPITFNLFTFFVPEVTLIASENELEIICDDDASPFTKSWIKEFEEGKNLNHIFKQKKVDNASKEIELKARTIREKYLESCKKILNHIQLGDVYELNYCMEFFDDDAMINPIRVYQKLTSLTEAPMSCLYKNGKNYLMSASPERFMKQTGNRLISQPIKGTIRRGKGQEAIGNWQSAIGNRQQATGTNFENKQLAVGNWQNEEEDNLKENKIANCQLPIANFMSEDDELKSQLYSDEKERAENVMIVDLVRNDLSRVAEKGSVTVEELFGIYTFKTVHQMISTVSCSVRKEVTFTEILKALFPMGSMTGAPKIRAMQLIEDYEDAKRGLFSGAVGYIAPGGDFDFNVVIRSIFYNEAAHYLSTWAGSAITINADPEKEYDECMLKLEAMVKALG